MPVQASTDSELRKTGERQGWTGSRLLALGAALYVIGLVLLIIGGDVAFFAGIAFCVLGSPPAIAGIALLLSGATSKRASRHKPFA